MPLTRALVAGALVVWMAVAGQVWAQSDGVVTVETLPGVAGLEEFASSDANRMPGELRRPIDLIVDTALADKSGFAMQPLAQQFSPGLEIMGASVFHSAPLDSILQQAGPTPALAVSCTGLVCTLDASASVGNPQLTYSFECNRLPVQAGCGVRSTTPSVAVTYPADGSERVVRVTVWDTDNVSKQSDWLTFRPGAPTPTATLPPPTVTATSTVTPTSTPSPTATDTPTPTATATSTAAPCPGVYVGQVVETNTLTVTCVKPTESVWPDRLLIPSWRTVP